MTITGSCWPRCWARIDGIDADIAVLDAQIEAHLAPFDLAAQRLDEIPGIGPIAAAVIIAEIGVDMTRFPTAGHLCSWAKFSPGINSSAGNNKSNGSTGHGDRYLARVLGEAAPIAGRTNTFPRRALPPDRTTPREEQSDRRGRAFHLGHHLAPARRSRNPLQ